MLVRYFCDIRGFCFHCFIVVLLNVFLLNDIACRSIFACYLTICWSLAKQGIFIVGGTEDLLWKNQLTQLVMVLLILFRLASELKFWHGGQIMTALPRGPKNLVLS